MWKSPDAAGTVFGGKKVAALIIDKDESLRISGEEALVRELTARGMQGVASYSIVPREELQNADKARVWYEQAGVEGVVAFRLVSDEKRRTWQPSSWSSPYYGSFWGYYGYGWGSVYNPGYVRDDRVISLETLIFSVPKNVLLWAGMSETENPKTQPPWWPRWSRKRRKTEEAGIGPRRKVGAGFTPAVSLTPASTPMVRSAQEPVRVRCVGHAHLL